MKHKHGRITEHYRVIETAWWRSLEQLPGQSIEHEALQDHVSEAKWRMVERLISAALREKLLYGNDGVNAGTMHLAPTRPNQESGVLVAEDFDPALTVLKSRFSQLSWRDDT